MTFLRKSRQQIMNGYQRDAFTGTERATTILDPVTVRSSVTKKSRIIAWVKSRSVNRLLVHELCMKIITSKNALFTAREQR